jgi:hypothetical protein
MGRRSWMVRGAAALGAVVTVAWFTGVAQAKPWAKLAPAPLASDSSYAAMSARRADSLSASELTWLWVQRDWRAQRELETRPWEARAISSVGVYAGAPGAPHPARREDARFARLASQPYEALTDSERAWLVEENAAQRVAREDQGGASAGGWVALGLLAGFVGGILAFGYMLGSIFD